jgi:hypothetical protein
MRYALVIACLTGFLAAPAPAPARADHVLVLIANADSPIDTVSSMELRKLYLGFPVEDDGGRPIRAITNKSSARSWEIFLQDVMGMSARSYERRLLTLTLQSGRNRPAVYNGLDELLERVESDEQAIAFVWVEDISNRENIKVLRVLWRN